MNWLRNALLGAIFVICFLLFIRWSEFQERFQDNGIQSETLVSAEDNFSNNNLNNNVNNNIVASMDTPSNSAQKTQNNAEGANDLPSTPNTAQRVNNAPTFSSSQLISVKTDMLHLIIDPHGGDIIKASLPKHDTKLGDNKPYVLLNRTAEHIYVARSGLIGVNGTDTSEGRPTFSTAKTSYTLEDGAQSLVVDLQLVQNNIEITKRFVFSRESYLINIEYHINNLSDSIWTANLYGQIKRDDFKPRADVGIGIQPYVGAAITTPEKNYKKLDFEDLEDDGAFKTSVKGGWVAMVQHYFMSAWVPDSEQTNYYNLRKKANDNVYLLEFTSEAKTIAAQSRDVLSTAFYVGPKNIKKLEAMAPYLDLTIDFSWLWFIAKPLFFALDFIHNIVGNWGVSIILLTIGIKIMFFYPSAMSYRSMAKMRKVQPLMQEMKERHGDDRQKMSTELMKMYKKEGVNPLGGCLPILLQMPVFISLYWVLMESVELRHAPFMLWIEDLSMKDPFFILPLIMGVTMYLQQKLNPTPPDPMQAKIMQMMPIFFTFLFMMFPAGLVLYWVVNNTLSICQQYVITKQIENS